MIDRVKKEEFGYSLVEVLAAILLLSIAIIPMVSMFDAGLEAASTSSNYDKARSLASTNLEAIKADSSKADGAGCLVPEEEPLKDCRIEAKTVKVASDSEASKFDSNGDLSMTKVKVVVEWGGDNKYAAVGVVGE